MDGIDCLDKKAVGTDSGKDINAARLHRRPRAFSVAAAGIHTALPAEPARSCPHA